MSAQKDCQGIDCIFNEKQKKGLCIGVSTDTKSYVKDVIRLCWVEEKPALKKRCKVKMQAQMTFQEAIGVGVGLIRSSIVGETLVRRMEAEEAALAHVKVEEATKNGKH
jgi:hypothetical protein